MAAQESATSSARWRKPHRDRLWSSLDRLEQFGTARLARDNHAIAVDAMDVKREFAKHQDCRRADPGRRKITPALTRALADEEVPFPMANVGAASMSFGRSWMGARSLIVIIGRALLKIGSEIEGRTCEICLVTRHCDPPNSTSSSEAVAKLLAPRHNLSIEKSSPRPMTACLCSVYRHSRTGRNRRGSSSAGFAFLAVLRLSGCVSSLSWAA